MDQDEVAARRIALYLRMTNNLIIGELTAKYFLKEIAEKDSTPEDPIPRITVQGRNLISGYPVTIIIMVKELREALSKPE